MLSKYVQSVVDGDQCKPYGRGESTADIASYQRARDEFGVNDPTVLRLRNRIVAKHVKYMLYMVEKFGKHSGMEHGDLLSAACIGLMRALETHDAGKKSKFTTYAYRFVQAEIRAAMDDSHAIRIPRGTFNDRAIRSDETQEAMNAARRVMRLNWPLSNTDDASDMTYQDVWCTTDPVDVQRDRELRETIGLLSECCGSLDERKQDILDARYRGDERTVTGKRWGISDERVRQIERQAMGQVREMMEAA